jgi:hypothetical protein
MKTIEITVQPDGQTRVETKGFTGPECQQASEFLEQALGQRTGEQLTAGFYQAHCAEQPNQQSTGPS